MIDITTSDKEYALFQALGVQYLIGRVSIGRIYRLAIESHFVKGTQGPAIESLRRCAMAARDCYPNRLTPEWDELIQLD